MTTALDIVTRAFRKSGISGEGEILEAETAVEGLVALNDMLHAWKLDSVDIGHSDLALDDDFPLGPEFQEGTVYLLASRLSPNYTIPPAFDADAWFRKIQAAYATIASVSMPLGLQNLSSQYGKRKQAFF